MNERVPKAFIGALDHLPEDLGLPAFTVQAEMNPFYAAQVKEILNSLGNDAVHLDDPLLLTSGDASSPDSFVETSNKAAFSILERMMGYQDSDKVWSMGKIIKEAMEDRLDDGRGYEEVCATVVGLIGRLYEVDLLNIPAGQKIIRNETKFFFDCNSADAYEFLADLGESAGADPTLIDRYRGEAQFIRYRR